MSDLVCFILTLLVSAIIGITIVKIWTTSYKIDEIYQIIKIKEKTK